MHVKSPGSVTFEGDERERIQRAQVALLLHITPAQVDEMNVLDVDDVVSVAKAQDELMAWMQARKQRKR